MNNIVFDVETLNEVIINQLDIYFLTVWEYWLGMANPKPFH